MHHMRQAYAVPMVDPVASQGQPVTLSAHMFLLQCILVQALHGTNGLIQDICERS